MVQLSKFNSDAFVILVALECEEGNAYCNVNMTCVREALEQI